ncbi:MAG TPA: TPM domain-containing protein [Nocardioidaceae bacterium]|nr:TPM domain-containing protein [Nocardioidaceae bacterium]
MRLVIASLLLTLLPAGASQAVVLDGCDELVLDASGLVDERAVRRAALQVQEHAAEIRVRVYESVPGGDLDAQERADRAACPTWRKPSGQRRDNLIVMSLSIEDRKVGLYYGAAWKRELRRRWTAIQSQAMSPAFKRGEWTEGLVGGLRATARAIDPMRNPSGSGDGAPPVQIVDRPDEVGGGSGDGFFVVLAIAALVIGALSFANRNGRGGGGFGGGGRRFRGGAATAGFFAGSVLGSRDSGGFGGHHDSSGGGGGVGDGGGGGGGGGSSSF